MTELPSKPRRRFLRFSLRMLLLLVVVIAGPLGWFRWKLDRARQQRISVAALWELGCRVEYDEQPDRQSSVPAWLVKLLGRDMFVHVVEVVGIESLADADLVHLRALPQLEYLTLSKAHVTDRGLVHLQAMTELVDLQLDTTQITDAGLINLEGLTRLKNLNLHGTQVTDAGLVHLQWLTQLEVLELSEQVTDAGLRYLCGLTRLTELTLIGTQVTDAGVQELKKTLPNVVVVQIN